MASDVAVSIDGEVVAYPEFEAYLRDNVGADEGELDSATLSRLFDQFLDEQLLLRLAIERGMVQGEVGQRSALGFLLRESRRKWSRAEVEQFYRAHRGEYEHPERVRLRQILTHDRTRAEEALAALESGKDFAEVAAELSEGPKAHLGGDQGVLARSDLPPKFVDVIFGLEPGETTEVIEAEYGFLVFEVVERLPAETVPLAAVEQEVLRRLEERHVDEQIGAFVEEARERYNVEVFPRNFPFEYQGAYATTH